MRRKKAPPLRNKLDLSDVRQVRSVKKRLRLSEAELTQIVGKIGNSIVAISKEVALQRARQLPEPQQVPIAAVAVSASTVEVETTETTVFSNEPGA
jgi:hypothetical protein